MYMKYVLLILIFNSLCRLYFVDTMPATANRSGPFVSRIERAEKCKKWSKPIDENPPIFLNIELYNTSTGTNLLRGNVTILKDCKNKKIRSKGFFWEGGKWRLVYLMNNMGCNSIFMPVFALITGVRYDQKNCIFFKGKYSFDNVDTNKTQHMFSSIQDYGRIMWRNEFLSEAGTAFCWEFETAVMPVGTSFDNIKQ